ncbi:hypothetical protein B0H16DRAFT_1779670, partial [Mycena metata]
PRPPPVPVELPVYRIGIHEFATSSLRHGAGGAYRPDFVRHRSPAGGFKNLERNKSAAQRQLNAIRDPVARLPLEISSEIFLGCLTSQREPRAHVAPLLFLNICNAWTDIAISTPAMWDTIELYFRGADCLRSWLSRAGKRMLTIALYRGLDHGVAEVLSQHASQLKHLILREEVDDELRSLVASVESFPQLDTLIIGSLPDGYDDYARFSVSLVLKVLRLVPNLVEFTLEGVERLCVADSPEDNLILSQLTSLKFSRLHDAEAILLHLTTPALETLVLPYGSSANTTFSLFFRRSSPPLEKLVLVDEQDGDFDLREILMQVLPSVTHLELSPYGRSSAVNLFSSLENLPSDCLQNLRTLIIKIRGSLTLEPSRYHAVLRFLSPRRTTIAHFGLFHYAYKAPPVVDKDSREGYRRLVDNGMHVWMGTNEHNYLAGWLQQPDGMAFVCLGYPKLIFLLDQ